MFDGLPELARYVSNLAVATRPRGPLPIVLFHHVGDLVNAARHALSHYFPIGLDQPYLQNSSLGTPYQKWAFFTNRDFADVDECLRRLIVVAHRCYALGYRGVEGPRRVENPKDAWHWFMKAATYYASCVVDRDQPRMSVSSLNMTGWTEADGPTFLNAWNLPSWERDKVSTPEIVTTREVAIGDRSVISRMVETGMARLAEMSRAQADFGAGLRAGFTMEDVTAPHQGTLSTDWVGVVTVPGTSPERRGVLGGKG